VSRVPSVRQHPEELAAANRRRTWLVLVAGGGVVVLLGIALSFTTRVGWVGVPFALAAAAIAAGIAYFQADAIVIASTGARPADRAAYERYHNIAEGLCLAAGLPKPRLYVVASPALNAFATGRDPDHAAIAITTGLWEALDRRELEAVIAHELAHVRNLDIRTMTVVAVVAGAIVMLADWTLRSVWYGGYRTDRRRGVGAFPIIAILGVVAAILAPLAAQLVRFAVSREREYLADASGVLLTRYPTALARALTKLRDDTTRLRHDSAATAHLWIKDPLPRARARGSGSRRSALDRLFATHPPIEDRIARLQQMGADLPATEQQDITPPPYFT